jgi:4-hydroxybenzoate polyprenyltransferase
LGYDTIYGTQDIADDEIIGIKSTSIKFKHNIKFFVGFCYFISASLVVFLFYNKFDINISSLIIIIYIFSLMYQIIEFKKNDPNKCLKIFKINNLSGLLLFAGIFLVN